MVFGFLRKLNDCIVNVGKGILGGAKNLIGKVMGVKDKVKDVATKINPEFGQYVDQGFNQFQDYADRRMNYANRGFKQVQDYAGQSYEQVQNVANRGRAAIQNVRQSPQYRNRIAPI